MRGDIWRTNILQGAEIIELYLWPKKSAIGWIFGPQTAFESTSSNLRPKTTEADKGYTLSLPSCRFQVVASELSLPSCRFHSRRDLIYFNVTGG